MLKETALAELHRSLGGKLVDFGGWNMPLHYGSQLEEHHVVRNSAGMFDVSHMTVVDVRGPEATLFLRTLLANDVEKLKEPGKALYTGMLNEEGGVIDDLIVYLMEWGYKMVVNCATREKDLAWITRQASNFAVTIQERPEFAIIAVQGPHARAKVDEVLAVNGLQSLNVFQGVDLTEQGKVDWFVARTGYTGEDGYEMILPDNEVAVLWQSLCDAGVKPCGLGARDTLRLEAGMNLYGHEMDEGISPLVANMAWTIAWKPLERDFIGRRALQKQRDEGIKEKLVGLVLAERGVMRAAQEVVVDGEAQRGVVTSGTFSPTLGHSIALARVPVDTGSHCEVVMRNKGVKVSVVAPSFVRHGKKVF